MQNKSGNNSNNKKQDKKSSEEKNPAESIKSFGKTLMAAIICAAIVRSCFFEPFHIPSSSMKPGLLIGDYIFVSKFSYGYSKYSFPLSLNLFSGRIFEKKPQTGDVAVFRLPSDPSINYIKRIIGVPGDKIQVKQGQLYINQEPIPKVYIGEFIDDNNIPIMKFKETLPSGKEITVLDQDPDSIADNTIIYDVPQGYYFAMGDNRDNSQDSRFLTHVGFIPAENLVGKASIIFFSVDDSIWKIWKWPYSIRFKRIFKKIK